MPHIFHQGAVMFPEKYPALFQFFAGYFTDADLQGLTDNEATDSFKTVSRPAELETIRRELTQLLSDVSVWEEAADAANRYFSILEQQRAWLTRVEEKLFGQD